MRQIAKALRISYATVQRRLQQALGAGLIPADALLPPKRRPDVSIEDILSLWLQRWPRRKIAQILGIGHCTVDERLREARAAGLIPPDIYRPRTD